ncbi:MAG: hypothetical protein GXP32_09835 [Kiritimatiellaeota bacterium]|nr:hypothetical protein [Kiritimatiellota bacterium]
MRYAGYYDELSDLGMKNSNNYFIQVKKSNVRTEILREKLASCPEITALLGYGFENPLMTLGNPVIPGHTHNECGSILLYGYGTRFLVDPGQGVSAAQMHTTF